MSYYFTDPYYYLPKSYPFIGSRIGYPQRIHSIRATSVGRHLQSSSVINRLDVATKYYQDNGKCEQRLLKNKYLSDNVANGEQLATTVAYRRNRENSLRKTAHRFPDFIGSKELIEKIVRQSTHAKAI